MNILELQVRVVISGVPESGPGPTLLDWTGPALDLLAAVPRHSTLPPDRNAAPERADVDQGWPGVFI